MPGTTNIIIARRVASGRDGDMIRVLEEGGIVDRGTQDGLLVTWTECRSIDESQTRSQERPELAKEGAR